jgi:DNA-binding NtrC family response regulator
VVHVGGTDIVVAVLTPRARPTGPPAAEEDVDDPRELVVAEASMRKVYQVARRLGRTQTSVLISGETGSGKEVVAETIHRASARATKPFVTINCASIPEALLESELFGHERGAFTGADRRRIGYVEAAHGGTLLLDEIGDMPLVTQTKLLRVLEARVVTRLGGTQEIPVDVRLLSATHRDLAQDIKTGRFREDLYYRIATFTISVPPLRERPAEIRLFAGLFARQFAERMKEPAPRISPRAEAALLAHAWPGNVRELRNAIEHAVVLAEAGVIEPELLPESARPERAGAVGLKSEVASVEKKNIEAALDAESANQTRAARRLGISRRALIYKMAKYGLK